VETYQARVHAPVRQYWHVCGAASDVKHPATLQIAARPVNPSRIPKGRISQQPRPACRRMLRTALSRGSIYPSLRAGARGYPLHPRVRLASTASSPRPFLRRTRLLLRWTGYAAASTVLGVSLITGVIFIHDAFTYNEAHVDKVPVSPLALQPETGGPKNLPVVSAFLGDIEDSANERINQKPRLVIVGGGWGVGGVHPEVNQAEQTRFPPGRRSAQQTFLWGLPCYNRLARHVHNVHSPPPMHVFILAFSRYRH
jgi:hypothetical protein